MKRHELRDRLAVAASELEHERDHEQAGPTQRRPHTSTPTQRRPPHPHTPPSRPYSGAKGDGSAAAAAPASFKKMTRSSSSPAQSKSILIATSRNQPVVADESQLSSLRGAHTLEMQRMRDAHEARLVEATQRVSEAEAHYVELSQLYASAETKRKEAEQKLRDSSFSATTAVTRDYAALEDRIVRMERLHEERERQLEEIVAEADFNHQIQMQRAEQNFRLAIRAKNREISSFRGELDAMMVALEEAGGGAALLDDGASILVYGEGKEKDGAGSFSSFAQAAQ